MAEVVFRRFHLDEEELKEYREDPIAVKKRLSEIDKEVRKEAKAENCYYCKKHDLHQFQAHESAPTGSSFSGCPYSTQYSSWFAHSPLDPRKNHARLRHRCFGYNAGITFPTNSPRYICIFSP